jgi:hypothetical protein
MLPTTEVDMATLFLVVVGVLVFIVGVPVALLVGAWLGFMTVAGL